MKIEARIFAGNGGFSFDLVDLDDILEVEGESLPELLYTHPKGYTHETTVERHANEAVDRFNKASDAERRSLCGYDDVTKCKTQTVRETGWRAGNRTTPVKQPE